MAGYSVLQRIIQARISAPAPSVTRQVSPCAGIRPADCELKTESSAGGRDCGLPADTIVSLLIWYASKECRRRCRGLITAVAAMANLSRETVYQARRGIMSEQTRLLLSRAISAIERGEVTFHRVRQEWRTEYHNVPSCAPPRTLDLEADNPATASQGTNDYGRPPKPCRLTLAGSPSTCAPDGRTLIRAARAFRLAFSIPQNAITRVLLEAGNREFQEISRQVRCQNSRQAGTALTIEKRGQRGSADTKGF